jgi:hypothetical protein
MVFDGKGQEFFKMRIFSSLWQSKGCSPDYCRSILVFSLLILGLGVADQARAAAPMFTRGSHIIHGSFSFSSGGNRYFENSEGDRTQEFILAPRGGYFISDGLALNLALEGSWFTLGDLSSTEYSFGPVVEYYFDTIGDDDPNGHVVPYVGGGFLWGVAEENDATSDSRYTSSLLTLTAGLAWFLSEHFATDIAVNYRVGNYAEDYPVDGNEFAANRWSLFIGIKGFVY